MLSIQILTVLHSMPWSIRVFYAMVLLASLVNGIIATRKRFKPHWRMEFAYTSLLTGVFSFYVFLRLNGVLDPTDYAKAVRWLYPLLVLPFIAVPLLFHWEDKFFKKALHAAIKKELTKSDDN